jgi:hypothetical protein
MFPRGGKKKLILFEDISFVKMESSKLINYFSTNMCVEVAKVLKDVVVLS